MPSKPPLTSIARRRLPAGIIAILDDPEALRQAIDDLHMYANANRQPGRPRRGIVYRVVEAWECQAIRGKLVEFFGSKRIAEIEALYAVPLGHFHIVEDSHISHICNRHGEPEAGDAHQSLTIADFERIPEVINPRHIVGLSFKKGMPRLIYERVYGEDVLVVVEELRPKELSLKTAYKKRRPQGTSG